MAYRDSQGKAIQEGEIIGRGGEATIYRVNGEPGLLAKIYEHAPRREYERKLRWMRDHPPDDPTAAQQHASLAWPRDLLFGPDRQLAGYLMPYIDHAVPLLDVFNPRRCTETLPDFNWRYLHRTARNLAAALGALHGRGYVVGDINESNILVTPRALVTMIDTDSFQVREDSSTGEVVHTCPVARLEYTPPELQGKSLQNTTRSPEQDAFGLGVLIYQLLMAGNHPFRAAWLGTKEPPPLEERIRQGCFPYRTPPVCPVMPPPGTPSLEVLHPLVSRLVLRCFIDGHRNPHRRPKPELWERAIEEAEKNLILCPNGHYYSNHLKECPVCSPIQRQRQGFQIPLPAAGAFTSREQPASPAAPSSQARVSPSQSRPVRSSSQPTASVSTTGGAGILTQRFSRLFSRSFWIRTSRYTRRSIQVSRQSLLDSLLKGALMGAGLGAFGGGLLAVFTWAFSQDLRWSPLITTGIVLGAAWRSLQIGQGIRYWVMRTIGWEAVVKAFFTLSFALVGGFIGWLLRPEILAVLIGGGMGALGGWLLGDAVWDHTPRLRWDQVGAGAVIALFAWLAWVGGDRFGSSWAGLATGRLISQLASWADAQQVSRFWISAIVGIIGGGLGGGLGGSLTESLAEVIGFRK